MARIEVSPDIQLRAGDEPNLMALIDLRNGNMVVMTHAEAVSLSSSITGFLLDEFNEEINE